MPTLEEVFLKCTAECAERDQQAGVAAAAGQPSPPDGRCTVEMVPPKQAASAAGNHAALPTAELEAESDGQEDAKGPSEEGYDMDASSALGSSNGGSSSEAAAQREAAGQAGSLSRDDSAEALNDVPLHDGNPSSSPQHKHPAAPSGTAPGHGKHAEPGEGNAMSVGAVEELGLVDVPLDDDGPRSGKRPPRQRQPRWAVALRQMLRKRAIIAGALLQC